MSENLPANVEQNIAKRQYEAMEGELMNPHDNFDLFANMGDGVLRESHSFGGDAKRNWEMVCQASAPDVKRGSEMLNKTIPLADYYCHEVDLVDAATGEITRAIRTVLYTPDGDRYAFVSQGVVRDLLRITQVFGKGPWKEVILVRPVQIVTGRKFHITRLMPG